MTPQLQKNKADQSLAAAMQAHQAGDRRAAEPLYLQALRAKPSDPHILHLLGALYYELKDFDRALEHLERSIAVRPNHAPSQSILGAIYSARGESDKALNNFRAVIQAAPISPDAHYNLGRTLLGQKHYAEAAQAYQKSLTLRPNFPNALSGLAASRKGEGRVDEAIEILRGCVAKFGEFAPGHVALGRLLMETRADEDAADVLSACLARHPSNYDALLLLGNLRFRQVNLFEAEALFRRLADLAPQDATANNYLGAVLLNLGRLDEAEQSVRRAFALNPEDPETLTNLGLILDNRGRSDEALAFHQRATVVKPTMPEAWNNLGVSQQNCGNVTDAIASYERAFAIKADFYGAKTNKAHALLALGRLSEGWTIYRHRFDQKFLASKRRVFPYPQWTGQADPSARLLLWTDQGLGDEVLYSSMLHEAQARVGHCILECYTTVVPLFQRSFPNVTVIARAKVPDPRIEDFKPTHQLPLIELAELFRPDLASIPSHDGYIKPDPAVRASLRARYAGFAQGKRIVGVSWKSENPNTGNFKTLPLTQWGAILNAPNTFFVSLQYGDVAADLAQACQMHGVKIFHDTEIEPLKNPDLSAAQIAAMDLVISTSNTTAHFAGGMGVPVWTMVPKGAGIFWYWFLERTDSPWYPSMRLFRQSHAGDWRAVVEALANKLREWAHP